MPTYNVRFYSTYCDEFLVEAANPTAAEQLADDYATCHHYPPETPEGRRFQLMQPLVTAYERECIERVDTIIQAVDAEGHCLEEARHADVGDGSL